jgi:hypothetical protein
MSGICEQSLGFQEGLCFLELGMTGRSLKLLLMQISWFSFSAVWIGMFGMMVRHDYGGVFSLDAVHFVNKGLKTGCVRDIAGSRNILLHQFFKNSTLWSYGALGYSAQYSNLLPSV